MNRPNWNDYFLRIAEEVSTRATCIRRAVGAIFVRDRQILSTGYNGVPKGISHCEDVGCLRNQLNVPSGKNHEICRGSHAEMNGIVQAATHGVSLKGATLYCTHMPCSICAKMLINANIAMIYYLDGYPDELSKQLLDEAKIQYKQVAK